MYAVKFFYGCLTKEGSRTRDKKISLTFTVKQEAEVFAKRTGRKVKKIGKSLIGSSVIKNWLPLFI